MNKINEKVMDIIQLKQYDFYYPMGPNIMKNLPIINHMVYELKKYYISDEHLALWCRGSSGAIIAGIIASLRPNTIVVHIRKSGEDSHSQTQSPPERDYYKNIIVDDFVSSGNTLTEMIMHMNKRKYKVHGICMGKLNGYKVPNDLEIVFSGEKEINISKGGQKTW